ncbi:MAG: 4-(cytidine 5'-diphospho)-2-C-methyl-D-erythritol kinase, partial [Actinomycetota bacterium]|nr:4-(cytidine 5'-diphospho)-2-C-methyl-D-erythritol kinase [Actinomycetota bacterium]
MRSAAAVRLRTNAKVNLFLRVRGRRPDGYHELESVFHGIALADDVEVRATAGHDVEVDLRLADDVIGEVPAPHENLATIAAGRLSARAGTKRGAAIAILKRIPLAAGLGGGSGNAAGVLVALNELWQVGLGSDELKQVAGEVGSDVPYCIEGGTALATARGEHLTALPSPASMWFVLGISNHPLYTREVYAAWDDLEPPEEVGSAAMIFALGAGDPGEVAALLHNDLEPAAFGLRPELQAKKDAMVAAGALGAALAGSGPTVYGIATDRAHGESIATRIAGDFDRVVVVPSSPH